MIPVIALTGYLGAGKTTVLNHLLAQPGARVGVVINDFGAVNVDAALAAGQVDEAASIAGGCICCLSDAGGLDEALERLTRPRLRLDAVIIEASGAADPLALAHLLHASQTKNVRPGGLIDIVDALEHTNTVDTDVLAPARFWGASLVVINKIDRIPPARRERVLAELEERIHRSNPALPVIATAHGRIDPALVYDTAQAQDPAEQLPFADPARLAHGHAHPHASAVTAPAPDPVDAGALADLLENPPPGAYRIKGCLRVRTPHGSRRYVVNVVGGTIHMAPAPAHTASLDDALVAIGMHLDRDVTQEALESALRPAPVGSEEGWRRLRWLLRASR